MKIYEIIIKPLSGFGTPIKGDTLFGQLCWQASYDEALFGSSIDTLLSNYNEKPFLVVSSAYPKIHPYTAFRRPAMPLSYLYDFTEMDKKNVLEKRKVLKKNNWMLVDGYKIFTPKDQQSISDTELYAKAAELLSAETKKALLKQGVKSYVTKYSQAHNTINRLTGTTGGGMFAPYASEQDVYIPETELVIYAGISEDISEAQITQALQRIGDTGFGKDATSGLGRFEVCEIELQNFPEATDANACYTLAPSVPERRFYKEMFFKPFVRFGRHGGNLANAVNPFKNPVIMADEGAVFVPADRSVFDKPYIGSPVHDISKADNKTVMQGYSLYIPVKVEVAHEQ